MATNVHETIEGIPLEAFPTTPSGRVEIDRFSVLDEERIYLEVFDYGTVGGEDRPLSACVVLGPAEALALAEALRAAAS